MEKLVITGGKKLKGSLEVKGAKNCALKIMAACILTDKTVKISNLPEIEDVFRMQEILKDLGCAVKRNKKNNLEITAKNLKKTKLDKKIVPQLRASVVLLGPMLARFKKVEMPHPGGCSIGKRPIDIFIQGLKALGAEVKTNESGYIFKTKGLKGTKFVFPRVSVTATETLMMAAVLAKGQTTLVNAASEPEVKALADFLNSLGAKIKGAGTPFVEIEGVNNLQGNTVKIIPDRIEAFSFLILAAVTNSNLTIKNCDPKHLELPLKILKNIGVKLKLGNDYVKILEAKNLKAIDVVTNEYPGFPTDCQAPLTVLLTQSKGLSTVTETIFEDRFLYTDLLNRMGAEIKMLSHQKIAINGPTVLEGKKVESPDLRAGIAMLIAALMVKGKTEIGNVYQIDRGYENIDKRLQKIGANIKRVKS